MDDISWPPKQSKNPKPLPRFEADQPKPVESIVVEPEVITTKVPPETEKFPGIELDLPDTKTPPTKPVKPKKKRLYFEKIGLSKKAWALIVIVVLVLLASGAYGAKYLYDKSRVVKAESPQSNTAGKPKLKPKPTTGPSPLTGAEVDLALTTRPVTGIMIENSLDARPQSGLKDAGIVYEAIAEGGITRFLALYQESRPDYIGPVRSVRPYYLDFLMPFNAAVAHVGGAPKALADIKTLGIHDLDEFANASTYQRITQRFAPHNVYTNFDKLDALNASKGFGYKAFTSFTRKKDNPSKTPNATSIDVAISGPLFDSHYDYNSTKNSYVRSEGGKPHTDERSGSQLAPKVIMTLVMNRGIDGDGQHTDYSTTAGGQLLVFQDGIVTTGTWSKADRQTQFVFKGADGEVLKLNPGQTWITLVDTAAKVTYK